MQKFANNFAKHWKLDGLPACRIEVAELPRQHTGLGVGTQLGLAVAEGLSLWLELGERSTVDLAMSAGRGLRSAVGTHGFARGGLIVELGKADGDAIGQLHERVEFPHHWRVLLVMPKSGEGLADAGEKSAFAQVPDVPQESHEALRRLAIDEMAPAARHGEFARFSKAVCEYGFQAGLCFESVQGGPYSSPAIEQVVNALRDLGVYGVGQSSWGPTVFAFVESATLADEVQESLRQQIDPNEWEIIQTSCQELARRKSSVELRPPPEDAKESVPQSRILAESSSPRRRGSRGEGLRLDSRLRGNDEIGVVKLHE